MGTLSHTTKIFIHPKILLSFMILSFCAGVPQLFAQEHSEHEGMSMPNTEMPHKMHAMGPGDCSEMQVWDYSTGMCTELPNPEMKMFHTMLHGNAFLVGSKGEGSRGRDKISSPNMIMGDIGRTLGTNHYVNLDVMLTAEKWTFPKRGYPLLLQVGEKDNEGNPYVDAQHPHSSPLMGLTLSDTIKIPGEKNYIKVFFAPRGQSTDGPTAFMHRATGMLNPDAPLGHHVGQDVGHISSTVVGTSVKLFSTTVEVSGFHGEEPEPDQVDLPLGAINSVGLRVIQEFSPSTQVMASVAYVRKPEPDDPSIDHVTRYSASIYNMAHLSTEWIFQNAFIFGAIEKYAHAAQLYSFTEEFAIHSGRPKIWGRLEWLQRTPNELLISGASDPDKGRWIGAATLGYTHTLLQFEKAELALGASITKSFIPNTFDRAYGGDPWAGKIFLQLSGMDMWMF